MLIKAIITLILLTVAAFCLFGFLATFEPGVKAAMLFRVGYAVAGAGCLIRIGWTISRPGNTP